MIISLSNRFNGKKTISVHHLKMLKEIYSSKKITYKKTFFNGTLNY